jgi:acyl-coenzyme A synthetase/AMP-(fatty) acid ligase
VTLPVDVPVHVRFYRTGDLVARHDDGEYVYLGRIDDQVKVLGHRVEPAEIEGTLRRLPGVVQAVALAWPFREGIAEGLAAVVTGSGLDPAELRSACRRHLPDYMVPRKIAIMDDLPTNVNGKVDRAALRRRLDEAESPVATGGAR